MANIHEKVKTYFLADCGMGTARDLLTYFTQGGYEEEIAATIKAKFAVTEEFKVEHQKLYVARARAAYKLAKEVDDRIAAEAAQPHQHLEPPSGDLERPMDDGDVEKLDKQWTKRHDLKLVNFMKPAPEFRNKTFRETTGKIAKFIPVEKAKSMEEAKVVPDPERTDMGTPTGSGARLILESTGRASRRITTTLEYVAALRLIMNTYSYCGSHRLPDPTMVDPNSTVAFFPLEVATAYVDNVTLAVISMQGMSEAEKVAWLRRRDEKIRSEMVALINEGERGGRALQTAAKKYEHMWIMRDGDAASCLEQPLVAFTGLDQPDQRPTKRQRFDSGAKGADKGGKGWDKGKNLKQHQQQLSSAQPRTSTICPDTRIKVCGAHNGKRGCEKNPQYCPQQAKHVCNVVLPNGKLCWSKDHTALTHSKYSR